jgi:1-pyrroline-5-carboxylate dehydrogenase
MDARKKWAATPWQDRAAIFLKAAELLAGPYRARMNAATMIGQSKNVFQAEIDAACELIDFFRFNVEFMTEIYANQPISSPGIWNRMEYRALEGFVYAITPFNFTSIAANLPAAPAMMGNVVVWKPARTQVYSAQIIMELFKEAGLPDGVINMVTGNSAIITEVLLDSKHFSGIHFTGSTGVFNSFWEQIGKNVNQVKILFGCTLLPMQNKWQPL